MPSHLPTDPPARVSRREARGGLLQAVRRGTPAQVAALLARHPDLVDARNAHGGTPIREAIGARRPEIVALLLERGADPLQANHGGSTLLEAANAVGAPAIAELLVSRGWCGCSKPRPLPRRAKTPAPGRRFRLDRSLSDWRQRQLRQEAPYGRRANSASHSVRRGARGARRFSELRFSAQASAGADPASGILDPGTMAAWRSMPVLMKRFQSRSSTCK